MLGLSVTTDLYPRLEASRYGAGQLTKIRAQAVSGRACRTVAERLGVPDRLREAAPSAAVVEATEALVGTERVLASVIEAVIGACYLHHGFAATSAAVVEAFSDEMERALSEPDDFKSELQERLARRSETVRYDVAEESGPPHDRIFRIVARVGEAALGEGSGKSKKDAEQVAARAALESLGGES